MPWEKSFNEDTAIEKAMMVFWQKGFEPASISDLIANMGITRGSLYNAFGDKHQLFIKALIKYDKDYSRALLKEMESINDPKLSIVKLFEFIVAQSLSDAKKKGCLLVNTASELAFHGDQINKIVRNGLRDFESFFTASITKGQEQGQIPITLDPDNTAKGLMAMVVAIRILSRGLFDEASLRAIAKQAQRLIS